MMCGLSTYYARIKLRCHGNTDTLGDKFKKNEGLRRPPHVETHINDKG